MGRGLPSTAHGRHGGPVRGPDGATGRPHGAGMGPGARGTDARAGQGGSATRPPANRNGDVGGEDLIVGAHVVQIVLQRQPRRVRAIYCWSRDARLVAAMRALFAQAVSGSGTGAAIWHDAPPPQLAANHLTQGVALQVRPYPYCDLDDLRGRASGRDRAAGPPILLALDGITDTHNLGAILRSAAFFGVDGVLLPADRAAHVTPAAERIARGGASLLSVAIVTNLTRSLTTLADDGWLVVGTALEGATGDLWQFRRDQPIVLVLGAEDTGIRPLVRRACQQVIRLDGDTTVQSLNVSAFAAVVLAALQRGRVPPAP